MIKFTEKDNKKTGFHAEAFYKNGKVVISIRGTDDKLKDLLFEDVLRLGLKRIPNQYVDAQKFYEEIKKDFPNKEIVFTGHSLGGSLAQLMGNKTGCETVTFNAYGVADILKGNIIREPDNIRNYGYSYDKVFNKNINNQLGRIYTIDDKPHNDYITSEYTNKDDKKTYFSFYHSIENMGNLEDAVVYKPNRLEGKVSHDIDFKDIDDKRIFTREEIDEMTTEEYSRLENLINKQLRAGKIMAKADADKKVKSGDLIWVNDYTRSDGTHVRGYYRSR